MRVDRHYCSALRVIRFVANENSSFHQTNSSAEFVCSRRSASRARCKTPGRLSVFGPRSIIR